MAEIVHNDPGTVEDVNTMIIRRETEKVDMENFAVLVVEEVFAGATSTISKRRLTLAVRPTPWAETGNP